MIVGANGCGKTTIIECLKYATTGALPPGASSGQSFVHDPKIAGTPEVKGQIKLKFKNRVPQTLVCVRNFQVSQAARTGKLSYKALDSTLIGARGWRRAEPVGEGAVGRARRRVRLPSM